MPTYADSYVNVARIDAFSNWRDSSIMRKFQFQKKKKPLKKYESNKNERLSFKKIEEIQNKKLCRAK